MMSSTRDRVSIGTRSWVSSLILSMLIASLITLPLWTLYLHRQTSPVLSETAALRLELDAVNLEISQREGLIAKLNNLRYEDELLNKQRTAILFEGRTADDVPKFSGPFITALTKSGAAHSLTVPFYVPAGEHRLVIDCHEVWPASSMPYQFAYELQSDAGYLLEIQYDEANAKEFPFRMTITCGSEGFEERDVTLPFANFEARQSSYSVESVLAFPGEVQDREKLGNYESGVRILQGNWNEVGRRKEFNVTATVVSNAEPSANPQDVQRTKILTSTEDPIYRGGGRFGLPGFGIEEKTEN